MDHNDPQPLQSDTSATSATSAPATPPLESASADEPFQPLDRRVINLWRVTHLIVSAVILVVLAIPAVIVSFSVPGSFMFIALGWGLIALYRLFMLFWYPPRAYRAWGYRLNGKVLETRSGVWFRVLQLLPLSRLQHVDLHRGPLERAFGLASLALHTAGTVASTIVIPGLSAETAAKLRDELVAIGGDDAV